MPLRQAQPFLGTNSIKRLNQIVEVGQALSHAHDHDVRQFLSVGQKVARVEDLFNDLGDAEVALDPFQAAGAEDATHSATDLRAEANRSPSLLGHENAFDPPVVSAGDEQLFGPIFADRTVVKLRAEREPIFRQIGAKSFRQIRHRLEIDRATLEEPLDDLARMKSRRADLGRPIGQFGCGRVEQGTSMFGRHDPIDRRDVDPSSAADVPGPPSFIIMHSPRKIEGLAAAFNDSASIRPPLRGREFRRGDRHGEGGERGRFDRLVVAITHANALVPRVSFHHDPMRLGQSGIDDRSNAVQVSKKGQGSRLAIVKHPLDFFLGGKFQGREPKRLGQEFQVDSMRRRQNRQDIAPFASQKHPFGHVSS